MANVKKFFESIFSERYSNRKNKINPATETIHNHQGEDPISTLYKLRNNPAEITFEVAMKLIQDIVSSNMEEQYLTQILLFLAHADGTGDYKHTEKFQELFKNTINSLPFKNRIDIINSFIANIQSEKSIATVTYTNLVLDIFVTSIESEYRYDSDPTTLEDIAATTFIPLGNLLDSLKNNDFYVQISEKTLHILESLPRLKKHAFAPLTVIIENLGTKEQRDKYELHRIETNILSSSIELPFEQTLQLFCNFIENNTSRAKEVIQEISLQFQFRIESEIRTNNTINEFDAIGINYFLEKILARFGINSTISMISYILDNNIWMLHPHIISESFLQKINLESKYREYIYKPFIEKIKNVLNENATNLILNDFNKIQLNIVEKQKLTELLSKPNYQSYQLFQSRDLTEIFERMSTDSINILIESFLLIGNSFVATVILITSRIKPEKLSENLQKYFKFNQSNSYHYAEIVSQHKNWNICPDGEQLFIDAIKDGAYVLYQPKGWNSPIIIKFKGKLSGITTGTVQLGDSLVPPATFVSPIGPLREELKQLFFINQRRYFPKPNQTNEPDFSY